MSFKPPGFATVNPFLHIEGAGKFVEFLEAAFGAEVRMYHEVEGHLVHGEISVIGTMIEMSEARPEWPGTRSAFHLYVEDVDAQHAKLLAAGATEIHPPKDQPYGERSSAVKDRWGNHWYPASVTDMAKRTDAST